MSDDVRERAWFHEQLAQVTRYFQAAGITPPKKLEVEFSLPPKLALWSETTPDGSRQIWVVSGDCPTDYLVFDRLLSAREAMSQFAAHWMNVSSDMKQGQQHPTTLIGNPDDPRELEKLGTKLEIRAQSLQSFAQRADIW